MNYPKMLYRAGGQEEIHGHKLATRIVLDEDDEADALADGWHLTTPEAVEAGKAAPEGDTGTGADAANAGPAGAVPPTRDEMKAKAAALGLTFKHNISNVALAELIAAAAPKD